MEKHQFISSSLKEVLNNYLSHISLSKSKQTVEAYTCDMLKFLEYIQSKGLKRITSLKGQTIVNYLSYQKSQGKSDASLNRYYMSIRSFVRYLRITKVIGDDITLDVPIPSYKQIAPYVPSLCEIEAILKAPSIETKSGRRDRAMLELLYSSGLRASEICDVDIKDTLGMQIIVRCGKRGKTRTIPITQSAYTAITAYIQERGTQPGPLFQTLMGKRLRRQLLCKMVTGYARKAGIEQVTTHTLRHACATHLLDQGADLRLIQEVLGHSSIASTQRYTHLSSNKIQEMFQHFHPRR